MSSRPGMNRSRTILQARQSATTKTCPPRMLVHVMVIGCSLDASFAPTTLLPFPAPRFSASRTDVTNNRVRSLLREPPAVTTHLDDLHDARIRLRQVSAGARPLHELEAELALARKGDLVLSPVTKPGRDDTLECSELQCFALGEQGVTFMDRATRVVNGRCPSRRIFQCEPPRARIERAFV